MRKITLLTVAVILIGQTIGSKLYAVSLGTMDVSFINNTDSSVTIKPGPDAHGWDVPTVPYIVQAHKRISFPVKIHTTAFTFTMPWKLTIDGIETPITFEGIKSHPCPTPYNYLQGDTHIIGKNGKWYSVSAQTSEFTSKTWEFPPLSGTKFCWGKKVTFTIK